MEESGHAPAGRGPAPAHVPVLVGTVVHHLRPEEEGRYFDGTVGDGGHAEALLRAAGPRAALVGCDRDPQALERARERLRPFGDRVLLLHGCYTEAPQHLARRGWKAVDGFLLDLGVSTGQLATPSRGFSFRLPGPLDMRFDPTAGETAAALLRRLPEKEIADLLFRYGEERHARRIARALVRRRRQKPVKKTEELADIVVNALPGRRGRIHPATRTFQALRIAVNRELGNLEEVLAAVPGLLEPRGRAVLVSFHSLEDRLVKQAFRRGAREGVYRVLTPKPLRPGAEEAAAHPACRSARLRAAERI